jgi:hypothetical protein
MKLIDEARVWLADQLIGEGEVEKKKIISTYEKLQDKDNPDEKLEHIGISEFEMVQNSEYYYNSIYYNFSDKTKVIKEWREMATFPEIADALDNICDEAVDYDENGEVVKLQVTNESILKNDNKTKNLQKEWEYVLEIMDFDVNAFNLFRKYYVESELFGEMVINPSSPKEGIKKVIILSPETMKVEFDEYENVKSFKQRVNVHDPRKVMVTDTNKEGLIEFSPNMIAYINSGITTKNESGEISNISYIDRAKIAYRQLKWMEDALLIYRIVRAPNRRVYTIDVGNLPKKKAEEYMNSIISKYRTRKVYNSATGEVDLGKSTQAMTEDIFLPKRSDGTGPDVTDLQGQAQIGDITDVVYFVKKLYKALKVPTKRLDEEKTSYFYSERDGENNVEEIKFAKYINRVRSRWVNWLKSIYIMHLKLKGIWQQYGLNENDIELVFNNTNSWRDALKMKNWSSRMTLYDMMLQHVDKDFSRTWLKKNILKMSDEELSENEEMIKQDAEKLKQLEKERLGVVGPQGGEVGLPPADLSGGMPPTGEMPPELGPTMATGGKGGPALPPEPEMNITGKETEEVKNYKGSMKDLKGNLETSNSTQRGPNTPTGGRA